MPLFRREPLHERLAREGGMTESEDARPSWDKVGIHGVARPRRWDTVVSVEAPDLTGDEVHFVSLPDGTLVVDEDVPDGSLTPLADMVETSLTAPYRVEAVRQNVNVWGVAARQIEVAELSSAPDGDRVTITARGGERTVEIDGHQVFGSFTELEDLADERGLDEYVVVAERIDGPFWEVRVSPL